MGTHWRDAPVRLWRFIIAVARRFSADGCPLHAAALAYVSLLSLVPLLALMFAVLKGLGVQRRLEPLLLSRLALDPDVADRIVTFIDRTNVGTLGAVGAAALLVTVLSVLASVERSFNHIWRVRRSRAWLRQATDYLSTVLVTPFLLLVAVAITSSLQEQALLRLVLQTQYVGDAVLAALRLAPVLINIVAIGLLYAIMPNRRPHVPGVLAGAAVAGCAWQLVQWGYVTLQIGVARYNAIYGALSQLPIVLVWLYLSWLVILAGAEVAAAFEFGARPAPAGATPMSRWAVALHLLIDAAGRFRGAGGEVDPRATARALGVDADVVAEVAETLQKNGLLAAVEGAVPGYVLARDPQAIDLGELDGLLHPEAPPDRYDPRVTALIDALAAERRNAYRHHRLSDRPTDARSDKLTT